MFYKITTKVTKAEQILLTVCAQKMHCPLQEGQNTVKTGGCNNDNPKTGVSKANMKTKVQESPGKKSEWRAEVRDQGNGRAHSGQRDVKIKFP